MGNPAIIGYAYKVGEIWHENPDQLIKEVGEAAIKNVDGFTHHDIDAFYVSDALGKQIYNASSPAGYLSSGLGVDKPVDVLEDGATALKDAYYAIKAGAHKRVFVGGFTKLTDSPKPIEHISGSISPREKFVGATMPNLFGLMDVAYRKENNIPDRRVFAEIISKDHHHGVSNPWAQYKFDMKPDRVLTSPLIADPIRQFEYTYMSDGAAGLILADSTEAERLSKNPIYLLKVSKASAPSSLHGRESLTSIPSVKRSAENFFDSVKREDASVLEIQSKTPVLEPIILEDLGYVEKGKAWINIHESCQNFDTQKQKPKYIRYSFNGSEYVVNPSGGPKARGNPVGVTPLMQAIDISRSLRGEFDLGFRPSYGLSAALSGTGSTATTFLFGVQDE